VPRAVDYRHAGASRKVFAQMARIWPETHPLNRRSTHRGKEKGPVTRAFFSERATRFELATLTLAR
jgi:hypothetical protein